MTTDEAMLGCPADEVAQRRRLHLGFHRLASSLEVAEAFADDLRSQLASPVSDRPELVAEIDKARVVLIAMMRWAWDAPSRKSEGQP